MQKIKRKSPWPLVRRMVGWGLVMAFLWGWFPILFGGELGLLDLLWPDPPNPEEFDASNGPFFVIDFTIPLVASCAWTVGGAVTGILAGYFAPSAEPRNPLKSPFFRLVGRETFWTWFWYNLSLSVFTYLAYSSAELPLWVVCLSCSMVFYSIAVWQVLGQVLPLVADE